MRSERLIRSLTQVRGHLHKSGSYCCGEVACAPQQCAEVGLASTTALADCRMAANVPELDLLEPLLDHLHDTTFGSTPTERVQPIACRIHAVMARARKSPAPGCGFLRYSGLV